MKRIKITENRLLYEIREFLNLADSDELARLAGEIFGGKCFPTIELNEKGQWVANSYDFEPDENYYGAFNNGAVENQ